MWTDVLDLNDFYSSTLGQMTVRLLRARLREVWPNVRGETVLGLGYATPFLRPFREEAQRTLAFMPAQQGVTRWPREGRNLTALVDEHDLPLPDRSVDRVLLVHAVECSEQLRPFLREIWRVMADGGRLVVVAPTRHRARNEEDSGHDVAGARHTPKLDESSPAANPKSSRHRRPGHPISHSRRFHRGHPRPRLPFDLFFTVRFPFSAFPAPRSSKSSRSLSRLKTPPPSSSSSSRPLTRPRSE